ncbi:MAG: acyl transferase [Flavobacteriales bacterium]|nr:acyl transferase [Flavobacteriales bacterium]
MDRLVPEIFKVDMNGFENLALNIFYLQSKYNPVYAKYIDLINVRPEKVLQITQIPFMPVQFFKTQKVIVYGSPEAEMVFESSSTGNTGISKHYVSNKELYIRSFTETFIQNYGQPMDYSFRFLLPSYLERSNSSLIYMAEHLLKSSGKGGFYLDNFQKLKHDLEKDIQTGKKIFLMGVSFALIDFAEKYPIDLAESIVMETGGMKGRRSEITRSELHSILKERLSLKDIHSEYGMTELLSQAYSKSKGVFKAPHWMKVMVSESTDPLENIGTGKTGQIKVIDLANLFSCSFLQTSDLGKVNEDGSFEVLGRSDNSDVRGCNLMYSPEI